MIKLAKKHLNIVWCAAFVLRFGTVTLTSAVPFILLSVLFIAVTLWVLHEKGQTLWWVLIPIAAPILKNNRTGRRRVVKRAQESQVTTLPISED